MNVDEAFPGKFLKAADLKGQRVRVEITNVTLEKIGENRRLVLELAKTDKKMVVNATNMNVLCDLTGSRETDDWRNWRVLLYTGKATFNGQSVPALRISDDPASAIPPRSWHEKRAAQAQAPRPPTEFESVPPLGVRLPAAQPTPAVTAAVVTDDSDIPF